MERVSYPVLNLGFVISGLAPGQVGFDLFEVPITIYVVGTTSIEKNIAFALTRTSDLVISSPRSYPLLRHGLYMTHLEIKTIISSKDS